METFAVTVFPVAKPDQWRAWVDSIANGDRADAHRQMMRRLGIKREHIRHQASPDHCPPASPSITARWTTTTLAAAAAASPTACREPCPEEP